MTDDHVTHPAVVSARRSIAAGARPLVLVVAPYGFGKTVFASRLSETSNRPIVWIDILDGDAAPGETVAAALAPHCGPCIAGTPLGHTSDCEVTVVVDDLDRAGFPAAQAFLRSTVSAFSAGHRHPTMRVVICLRDRRLLEGLDLVKPLATGRLAVVGPENLRLTSEDLEKTHGNATANLLQMHAGWPLGTELASRSEPAVKEVDLWRGVLGAAPEDIVSVVAAVAGPHPVPVVALTHGLGGEAVDRLADWTWRLSPKFCTLVQVADTEAMAFSPAALDAISSTRFVPIDAATAREIAAACDQLDHVDAALSILITRDLPAAAAELVEHRAIGALESGQPVTLARWIGSLPEKARTPVLDLALASTSVLRGRPAEVDLSALIRQVWKERPDMGPWAACIAVWNMLAQGDPGLLPIASDALTRILGASPTPARMADSLTLLDPETAVWAARMVIAQAILLLVSGLPDARIQAHSLMAAIDTALRRHSLGAERLRALFTVLDYYVGGREPHDADIVALPYIRAMDAPLGVWPVLILTWHLLRCGDVTAGRVALDELGKWIGAYPEISGGSHAWPVLSAAGLDAALVLLDPEASREIATRAAEDAESVWPGLLRSPAADSTTMAVLFGIACLDAGLTDHARRWYRRAASGSARLPLTALDVRALGARLEVRTGNVEVGLGALDDIIAEHRAGERPGAVAVVSRWTILDLAAIGHMDRALVRLDGCTADLPGEWRDSLKDGLPTAANAGPCHLHREMPRDLPIVSASAAAAARGRQIVLVVAPYGFGKKDLTGVLAAEWGGDTCRFRAVEMTAVDLSTLSGLSARTCVIVEGLEAAPDTLSALTDVIAEAEPEVRFVLTSSNASHSKLLDTPDLLRPGRMCLLQTDDLRLRPEDLRALLSEDDIGPVLASTGGWPLATRFAVTDDHETDQRRLAAAALHEAPREVQQATGILGPLSPIPMEVVRAALDEHVLGDLAAWTWDLSPLIASHSGESVRFVASETVTPDTAYARQIMIRLRGAGYVPQAIDVAVSAGLDSEAIELITSDIRRLLDREGRTATVRRWIAHVRPDSPAPALVLAEAAADIFAERPTTDVVELVDETWRNAPDLALRAAGLAGWKLLHTWDPRFLDILTTTLARTYGGPLTPRPLSAWLQSLDTSRLQDATDALLLLVIASLHTLQPAARDTSRTTFDVTERALRQRGLSAEPFTALFTAHDCMSGGRVLDSEVCDLIVRSARTVPHVVTPWTAVATAQTALRGGDDDLALRALDLLDEWLVSNPELGRQPGSTPAFLRRVLDHALAVGSPNQDTDRLWEEGERLWQAGLTHDASRAAGTAVFVAGRWLDAGQVDRAEIWLRRSTRRKSGLPVHADGHALLQARLAARSGDVTVARNHLEELVKRRTATGHEGIVAVASRCVVRDLTAAGEHGAAQDLLDTRRDRIPETWTGPLPHPEAIGAAAPRPEPQSTPASSARLVLLAPEVQLVTPEGEARPLSGQAARLLAALVASDGHLEIDRAVDLLFPDLDLESGRKRLHSTMYRTRRSLGAELSHLLTLEGDVVHLKPDPALEIDVWDFSTAIAEGRPLDAVSAYREHFCSRQFAYADFAIDERRILRNRFTHAAVMILTERLRTGATGRDAELARTCCALVPDDEALARAAIAVLRSLGSAREARELAASSAARMEDFGPSAEDLFGA